MKKCPQCSRTYSDDTLSFCLADGFLLSASFDAEKTQAKTLALNADEIPTVVAKSSPAENSVKPRLRWYIYLFGFIVSSIVYLLARFLLLEYYIRFSFEAFARIYMMMISYSSADSFYISDLAARTTFNFVLFALIGIFFGFIWSEAGWKWGVVITIPAFIGAVLFLTTILNASYAYLLFYISAEIFAVVITAVFACFCSFWGALLSKKLFEKPAA